MLLGNRLFTGICIFIALLLSSCGQQDLPFDTAVFHYNQFSGISSLDPAFARDQANIWACSHLYNGLVQLDDKLQVMPAIAQHWELSRDGLTYTFQLRTDVCFHTDECFKQGTRKVKAQDVFYSFSRLVSPKTASPGAWVFNGRLDTVEPFKVINDSTFELKLVRPFGPMLGILSMSYCAIVPHEAVAHYGADFRAHPVGTGPFQLKIWREGAALILTRNEQYFEMEGGTRLPYIKGVRVSFMNNKKTEFVAFKQGKLDFVSGIDASFMDEVIDNNGNLKPAAKAHFCLTKAAYLNTEYLGFLMNVDNNNIFHDKRIRQAINYGFDRKQLIQYLRNGVGKAAENGFTPPGLPSYDSSIVGYTYNPTKALQLLKDAGYENGKGLPTISISTNDNYKEMALMLSKQLDQIGIHLKVEVVEPAMLREWMAQGKADFFRGSWLADYPDAENYFTVFYSHNSAPPNYTRFKNADYDRLYEQALLEPNDSIRYAIYHQLEKIILTETPIVPLYYDEVLHFTQKRVQGLSTNGMNLLDLKRVKLN